MKISHEVPLCMLEESRKLNNYDYALVHLFDENKRYYDFFKESLKMGREVLLDNSIFELGTAFDTNKFVKYIKELKPTEYVVPDVWWDSKGTIEAFKNWKEKYKDLPGKMIGVVQGKTLGELIDCYKYMIENADKIAISFTYPIYQELSIGTSKLHKQMVGRRYLINLLRNLPFDRPHKPFHLFGCSLPQEYRFYKTDHNIESMDTSNPIVHGILNIRYTETGDLFDKEKIKLVELLNEELDEKQKENINYNIKKFKENIL